MPVKKAGPITNERHPALRAIQEKESRPRWGGFYSSTVCKALAALDERGIDPCMTGQMRKVVLSIEQMSAALFESLISNHTFVDGNKRAAFFICDIFLRLNGWKLAVEPDAAHTFIVGSLENGSCDFDHLLPWIQRHTIKK